MDYEVLWSLFKKTGDVRIYLMYREELARELIPELEARKKEREKEENRRE